jgi:hypothetical protein
MGNDMPLTDTEMQVPFPEVDCGVSIAQGNCRFTRGPDLPNSTWNQRADVDVVPLLETVFQNSQECSFVGWQLEHFKPRAEFLDQLTPGDWLAYRHTYPSDIVSDFGLAG